jgi:hypothetical protein
MNKLKTKVNYSPKVNEVEQRGESVNPDVNVLGGVKIPTLMNLEANSDAYQTGGEEQHIGLRLFSPMPSHH